jgi:hypothetical protein
VNPRPAGEAAGLTPCEKARAAAGEQHLAAPLPHAPEANAAKLGAQFEDLAIFVLGYQRKTYREAERLPDRDHLLLGKDPDAVEEAPLAIEEHDREKLLAVPPQRHGSSLRAIRPGRQKGGSRSVKVVLLP